MAISALYLVLTATCESALQRDTYRFILMLLAGRCQKSMGRIQDRLSRTFDAQAGIRTMTYWSNLIVESAPSYGSRQRKMIDYFFFGFCRSTAPPALRQRGHLWVGIACVKKTTHAHAHASEVNSLGRLSIWSWLG